MNEERQKLPRKVYGNNNLNLFVDGSTLVKRNMNAFFRWCAVLRKVTRS
jgi:hypothetical protein